jgi:hypothetical protein
MATLPDLTYQRVQIMHNTPTICDYIRQRLQSNPAQVVKLLIELDDARALLNCLAPQTDAERTAALDFHTYQSSTVFEDDTPFDQNTDE